MKFKERLRPLFEWLIYREITLGPLYAKGREKSRLGFLPDAVIAGGFAASIISTSWYPIVISLLVRTAMMPIFLSIGMFWKRSGAWEREAMYLYELNLRPGFEQRQTKRRRTINQRHKGRHFEIFLVEADNYG